MTEPKFTPGPWHIYELGCGYEIRPDICWVGESSHTPREQQKANANLIAAAPAMYASLQNCVNLLRHLGVNEFASMVETTLRQARGESEVEE